MRNLFSILELKRSLYSSTRRGTFFNGSSTEINGLIAKKYLDLSSVRGNFVPTSLKSCTVANLYFFLYWYVSRYRSCIDFRCGFYAIHYSSQRIVFVTFILTQVFERQRTAHRTYRLSEIGSEVLYKVGIPATKMWGCRMFHTRILQIFLVVMRTKIRVRRMVFMLVWRENHSQSWLRKFILESNFLLCFLMRLVKGGAWALVQEECKVYGYCTSWISLVKVTAQYLKAAVLR